MGQYQSRSKRALLLCGERITGLALRGFALSFVILFGTGARLLIRMRAGNVQAYQQKVLKRILRSNESTVLAADLGLRSGLSLEDFRKAKPVSDYEYVRPYIEESLRTARNLLSPEPIAGFTTTSGTSSAPKRILLTRSSLRRERRMEILLAIHAILIERPSLIFRPALLMIAGREKSSFGRADHHAAANALFLQSFFGRFSAIPASVYDLADYEAKYYYYALLALAAGSRLVITPNPSTIIKLIETRERHAAWIEEDLAGGTLRNRFDIAVDVLADIEARLAARRKVKGEGRFPSLRAVACWRSGTSGFFWRRLTSMLPARIRYFDLGYLASDSALTYRIGPDGEQVCAFDQVFFEFLPIESECAEPVLYSGVEPGRMYRIVITNRHGLYRYDIGDVVRATGRFGSAATIEFVRKSEGFSNLTGEKLSEEQVLGAVALASESLDLRLHYFAVAPDLENSAYVLYAEADRRDAESMNRLGDAVDRALKSANQEYRAKRDSGRLAPIFARRVEAGAFERCKALLVASGRREAQFKLPHLIVDGQVRTILETLVAA
jgi:hypothetical protein